MDEKTVEKTLLEIEVGDYAYIKDCITAARTGENEWSICDNGEAVDGCDLKTAIRIVLEDLE